MGSTPLDLTRPLRGSRPGNAAVQSDFRGRSQVTMEFQIVYRTGEPARAKSGPSVNVPGSAQVLVIPLRGNANNVRVSTVGPDQCQVSGITIGATEVPREYSVTSLDQIWMFSPTSSNGDGILIQVRQ